MKKSIALLVQFVLVFFSTKDVLAVDSFDSLKLVWADEFNYEGKPDQTKWNYNIGTGSNGWGNAELEYYTDRIENAYCSKGTLKIKSIKELYKGSQYTSARLLTKDKFEFTYGRIVIRAKLPATKGTWPAAWMLGADIDQVGWPKCGEIDIMEHRGSEPNKIFGTFHYPEHFGANPDGKTIMIQHASSQFHVYRADWNKDFIKIYVDDTLIHSLINTPSIPFSKKYFILLNFAMGGHFGGLVDPAFVSEEYEVDYVRVYQ